MTWSGPRVDITGALDAAGVPYTFLDRPGYGTPSRPSGSGITSLYFAPVGVLIHYPVGIDDAGPDSMLNLVCCAGTSRVPWPIYQVYVDHADGGVFVVTEGRANHAGMGDGAARARAEADQPPQPPGDDTEGGNRHWIGITLEGPPTTSAQRLAAARVCAALCLAFGWSSYRVLGHEEHTARKSDPDFAMPWFRGEVELAMSDIGGTVRDERITDEMAAALADLVRGVGDANRQFPTNDKTSFLGIGRTVTRAIRMHTRDDDLEPGDLYDHDPALPAGFVGRLEALERAQELNAASISALDAAIADHRHSNHLSAPTEPFNARIEPTA